MVNNAINPVVTAYQMVDAWGGWELFQELLRETHRVAQKHDVSIPIVAVKYILDQVSAPVTSSGRPYSIFFLNQSFASDRF
jgi:hypothetical protein